MATLSQHCRVQPACKVTWTVACACANAAAATACWYTARCACSAAAAACACCSATCCATACCAYCAHAHMQRQHRRPVMLLEFKGFKAACGCSPLAERSPAARTARTHAAPAQTACHAASSRRLCRLVAGKCCISMRPCTRHARPAVLYDTDRGTRRCGPKQVSQAPDEPAAHWAAGRLPRHARHGFSGCPKTIM